MGASKKSRKNRNTNVLFHENNPGRPAAARKVLPKVLLKVQDSLLHISLVLSVGFQLDPKALRVSVSLRFS